jgi:16S rRNA C967 or C1407 C5-methylase (RsmB/RsmF family)
MTNWNKFKEMLEEYIRDNPGEIERMDWMKSCMAYKMEHDKYKLKEMKSKVREVIIEGNESGMMTRQEVVSMLPSELLGVKEEERVLDLCAAPGSKTSQMLENIGEGVVVANEPDLKRGSLLIHQLACRGLSGAAIVTSHLG